MNSRANDLKRTQYEASHITLCHHNCNSAFHSYHTVPSMSAYRSHFPSPLPMRDVCSQPATRVAAIAASPPVAPSAYAEFCTCQRPRRPAVRSNAQRFVIDLVVASCSFFLPQTCVRLPGPD